MKSAKTEKVETKAVGSEKKREQKIISHRRACDARGTGLSHYILMDKKGK